MSLPDVDWHAWWGISEPFIFSDVLDVITLRNGQAEAVQPAPRDPEETP